uniref:Uncharacterized protein n=1 Tax=Solanum lycopersicum TaxID=4081 RepID=K4B3S3_SOLLC
MIEPKFFLSATKETLKLRMTQKRNRFALDFNNLYIVARRNIKGFNN